MILIFTLVLDWLDQEKTSSVIDSLYQFIQGTGEKKQEEEEEERKREDFFKENVLALGEDERYLLKR